LQPATPRRQRRNPDFANALEEQVNEKKARKAAEKAREREEDEKFEAKLKREREQLTVEFLSGGKKESLDMEDAEEKGMTQIIQEMDQPKVGKMERSVSLGPSKQPPVSLHLDGGTNQRAALKPQLQMVSEHELAVYGEHVEYSSKPTTPKNRKLADKNDNMSRTDREWDGNNDGMRTRDRTVRMPRTKVVLDPESPAAANYMNMLQLMEQLPEKSPGSTQRSEAPPLIANQMVESFATFKDELSKRQNAFKHRLDSLEDQQRDLFPQEGRRRRGGRARRSESSYFEGYSDEDENSPTYTRRRKHNYTSSRRRAREFSNSPQGNTLPTSSIFIPAARRRSKGFDILQRRNISASLRDDEDVRDFFDDEAVSRLVSNYRSASAKSPPN
jgi:hypothetical protein